MKQKISGFTLLEFAVVIVILGVLAALALPNLIAQVNNAQGTEALQMLSMGLATQQTRHIETGYFAPNWAELNVEPNNTESDYYYYLETTDNRQAAILKAVPKNKELKGYLAGIEAVVQRGEKLYPQSLCEANKPGAKAIDAAVVEFRTRRVVCGQKLKRVK